jgi:large subunit ribosomal protein L17
MKHKSTGRKFSRVRKQRRMLIKTLLGSLIMHEKMKTTEAKAKETKMLIDRLINIAKTAKADDKIKIVVMRQLQKRLPKAAVIKLVGVFSDKFNSRKSGYARVVKTGRRKSDGARMAIIEFV